jgi:hypothetical protein
MSEKIRGGKNGSRNTTEVFDNIAREHTSHDMGDQETTDEYVGNVSSMIPDSLYPEC